MASWLSLSLPALCRQLSRPAPNDHHPFAGTRGPSRSAAGMAPGLRGAFRGSGCRSGAHRSRPHPRPKPVHV